MTRRGLILAVVAVNVITLVATSPPVEEVVDSTSWPAPQGGGLLRFTLQVEHAHPPAWDRWPHAFLRWRWRSSGALPANLAVHQLLQPTDAPTPENRLGEGVHFYRQSPACADTEVVGSVGLELPAGSHTLHLAIVADEAFRSLGAGELQVGVGFESPIEEADRARPKPTVRIRSLAFP
ncbi:MAG: hypothetical protein KTR31_18330 [Myxococcales bacterium]|nr:hypothetical protein [Myxococcales bacterium]